MVTLVSALRQTPEARRRVVVLYHLVDLSIEQIAQETGAPTGTAKARLTRSRKALAPLVSEFDDDRPQPGARDAHQPRRGTHRHTTESEQEAATHG
jgi:RNA polymerase sigma-70 factor (ECF subfamily)